MMDVCSKIQQRMEPKAKTPRFDAADKLEA
jgi:hypothetical protein